MPASLKPVRGGGQHQNECPSLDALLTLFLVCACPVLPVPKTPRRCRGGAGRQEVRV